MHNSSRAKLILEDGSVFPGLSFGYDAPASGEVVFSTGMTGYPESLTDPSFRGQLLVLTYPLIGNYGVPEPVLSKEGIITNFESGKIHVSGLIVAEYTEQYSHWNASKSLGEWLKEYKIPGLSGIDTRALTKKLREKGVMLGRIVFDKDVEINDINKRNLVSEVSIEKPFLYSQGRKRIILLDCGVKNSIITNLIEAGASVLRVPWDYDFNSENFDGLVISNGPGNPKMCKAAIKNVKKAIEMKKPIFGICFGNQILALAAGADTYKLKYGHRSQNQPCIDRSTGKCYITSQNHGFAVDAKTLPRGWKEWFINANDGTNEGIIHESGLFRTVQFHPEANPGPADTAFLFRQFMEIVNGVSK